MARSEVSESTSSWHLLRQEPVFARFMAGLALSQFLTFTIYLAGGLTPWSLVALAIVDGFFVGLQITALLTTQAGLVPHRWRGAAEITNALRIGIGSIGCDFRIRGRYHDRDAQGTAAIHPHH